MQSATTHAENSSSEVERGNVTEWQDNDQDKVGAEACGK